MSLITAQSPADPPRYASESKLCVITSYYNPCGYKSRRENYDLFARAMRRSGIQCITVECAFGDEPFELPDRPDVIQIRNETLLWQKERLLNLAASWLPRHYEYVAWVDCDVIFTNPNWARDTARLLKTHNIAQLFEVCTRLCQGNIRSKTSPNIVMSCGAIVSRYPQLISCGHFERHGHTGYGWAMRREIFDQVGLYEYAIGGTGDHYMAHAVYNDYGFCIELAIKKDPKQLGHLREWGERFHKAVKGKFTAVPGEILHLWHGDLENRNYAGRTQKITEMGYNPNTDIIASPGQPLQWHPRMNKPALKQYFIDYFRGRREDG